MKSISIALILPAALLVAACSTDIHAHVMADRATLAAFKFLDVEVASAAGPLPPEVPIRLQRQTLFRLSQLPHGDTPAKVVVTVTQYRIVSDTNRFVWGLFAGSNRMTVSVKVTNAAGSTLAEFDVERSANPGTYGVFYDQSGVTIDTVADGIAEALRPKG